METFNRSATVNMKEWWLKEYMSDVYEIASDMKLINKEWLVISWSENRWQLWREERSSINNLS